MKAHIACGGGRIALSSVLVDTGSESTCFEADLLRPLGLVPAPDEVLQVVHGVGGSQTVYSGRLESITIGGFLVGPVTVDIGAMGYGFDIEGILGMDFLDRVGAIIDLPARTIHFSAPHVR